jgi:predicted DNA-binding transcriptional regulator AlpA
LTQPQAQPAGMPFLAFSPLLSDRELADILVTTVAWLRAHASEIPGFERLGTYYRFRSSAVEQWLGSLNRLLDAEQAAELMKVPTSWVYANADEIPGALRLGRYVRFRPTVFNQFLGGSEVVQ